MRTSTKVSWLSPKHLSTEFHRPVPVEKKVELFEARVLGWQLDIAEECANGINGRPANPHAGFAVLHLCLSYFETIAKYEAGFARNGQSEKYFKLGLAWVFPNLKRVPPAVREARANLLYKSGRCGLYHASQTNKGILLGRPPTAIRFAPKRNVVLVNPYLLPSVLRKHLRSYCERLRKLRSRALRQRFEIRFDFDNPGLA
jgi:hypothetical protein